MYHTEDATNREEDTEYTGTLCTLYNFSVDLKLFQS